jgi:hypothetical protein
MSNKDIQVRTVKNRELVIEQLKKTPIVQIVCEKVGISRSTYYRWRNNKDFCKKSDQALQEGSELVNDMAESQLLSAIREQNMTAIIFWLKHHHKAYATKVELHGKLGHEVQTLTKKQEKLIQKALSLASQLSSGKIDNEK